MITIVQRQGFRRTVQVTVCDNPTLGSWGSHQLLLHEYRMQEEDEHWDQARFNMKFLKDKQLDYGPLWCVYCGKEELKIYGFQDKKRYADMATADHVIPKSLAPHLAKDKRNLRVACWHCNTNKGSKEWKENFPYD
jgi:5-methylcytosine-specific restriction endonuclease McrA